MELTEGGVLIASAALAEALAHAATSPDREVCGLLLGSGGRIERALAARNVSPDPVSRFELDPAALFSAMRAERAGGPLLLGHYHSHPGGSARPSACDLAAAEPGPLWLILGAGDARLWRATTAGFRAVAMRPF